MDVKIDKPWHHQETGNIDHPFGVHGSTRIENGANQ